MIDFTLTEQQLAIQKMTREFVKKEIIPVAAEYDEKEEVPWHILEKAHDLGLTNLNVPEEYGGPGLDSISAAIIAEEVAYGCLGIQGVVGVNALALYPILIAGSEAQKEKFFKPFCARPQLAAFALTEPNAGSDIAGIQTTAVLEGDYYILNGTKCFISNGGLSSIYTFFASTDRQKGIKSITAFVVPGDTPGVTQGKKENKMGDRASTVAEVILQNVRVPKENILGKEGDGFKIAMLTLDKSRPIVAACAVGVARRALDEALKYSKERVQFGRPICKNQGIQFMLADMAVTVDAARLLAWRAAWAIDHGVPVTCMGAMAKCYASDVAMKVTVDAVQIFGGSGYMKDYPVEKLMRDAKILQIYEGTNQIQRMTIARELLENRRNP